MELPKFFGLKSIYNSKYLRYIQEHPEVRSLHRFSDDTAVNSYAKFEVEPAKIGKGLVHIRSVYNNKYWVRWSPTHWWIAANADQPDEDQSKWTCTLFQPIAIDSNARTLRLRHVQLGHWACLWRAAAPYDSCLFAGSKEHDKDSCDVFSVFDWESLFVLPKYLAFKGDNGAYLKGKNISEKNFLIFEGNDINDPAVANEVFSAADGTVRIKSLPVDRFWLRDGDWIVAESNGFNFEDPNTLFHPTKVGDNVVGLRNLGNKLFSKRLTDKGITGGLSAIESTVTKEARLEIEELVASREIENVNFRLSDGRIYNKKVTTVATGIAENRSSVATVIDVKLSYDETDVSTWNSTVSVKLGVKTSIKSSIPIVLDGKLSISSEFSGEYRWGEAKKSTKKVDTVHRVLVQPLKRVRVDLVATEASCDVPFSYIQHDTLINGQKITQDIDDGRYSGVNSYGFKFETKVESLQ